MLQYILVGLVLGGIYAITASGLVFTYQSTGVLNFSFGAIAYTVARFYYFLNTQHTWAIVPSALLSIAILGPAIGLFLYFSIFRFLGSCSTLVKILATIGISVALPNLDNVVFGNTEIVSAPGLAPIPVRVFHVIGVAIDLNGVIVYACVLALLIIGFCVMRYTDVGLQLRAIVDSPAMTSLSGTNPGRISMVVWMINTTLAGLAGVLIAPLQGLDSGVMTLLMTSAFAAVVAAKLSSLPKAVITGFAMGAVYGGVQDILPSTSVWTTDALYTIPLAVIVIALIYYYITRQTLDESIGVGGALDRAIRPQGGENVQAVGVSASTQLSWRPSAFAFLCLVGLPLLLHGFWIGLVAEGLAYATIFLSFSLVTGEGGMIWLCQATFAGVGGMAAALIAERAGIPILLAILIGGFIAVPCGALIGLLTIRMGDLYVALVTLTFGLFVDDAVFTRQLFDNTGLGTNVVAPSFAGSPRVLTYVCLAVFVILAMIIANLRRSTTGLAMTAIRSSPIGAATLGVSVVRMKLLVAGLAAFVAGIGGGMLAITFGSAIPPNYATLGGEVWLVVLVTQGLRSTAAAGLGGLSLTVLSGVATAYLPQVFTNFVPIFFGLGAVAMTRFPEGVLVMQARQFRSVLSQVQRVSPSLYTRVKLGAAIYFVTFVVLLVGVRHLWWLWLAITAVIAHVVAGYLISRGVRGEKAARISVEAERPTPVPV